MILVEEPRARKLRGNKRVRRERYGGRTYSRAELGIRSEDQETYYNKRNPPGCESDVGKGRKN